MNEWLGERVVERPSREEVRGDGPVVGGLADPERELVAAVVGQILQDVETDRGAVDGLPITDRALHDQREVILGGQCRAVLAGFHVAYPRVHASGVRIEMAARLRAGVGVELLFERSAVRCREELAVRVVALEHDIARFDERAELSAHEVADEIHEKEAILRVEVTERREAIIIAGAREMEDAILVVRRVNRAREPAYRDAAVVARTAARATAAGTAAAGTAAGRPRVAVVTAAPGRSCAKRCEE